jgi:hypothetical protein
VVNTHRFSCRFFRPAEIVFIVKRCWDVSA